MFSLHCRKPRPLGHVALWFLTAGLLLLLSASAQAGEGGGYVHAGLMGSYYANPNFSGSPSFTRRDVRLGFKAGCVTPPGGSPSPGFRDVPAQNWSAVWVGRFVPRFSETYVFKSFASNSVVVKVKKTTDTAWTTVINQPAPTGADSVGGYGAPFTAGTAYDVEVDYVAASGPWGLTLRWASPSTPEEVIDPLTQASLNALTYTGYPDHLFADQMRGGRDEWMQPDVNGGYGSTPAPRDSNGWPMSDAINIVFEEGQDHHGDYLLQFQGQADVSAFFHFAAFSVGGTSFGDTLPAGVAYDAASGQGYNPATNTTTATVTVSPSASILYLKFVNSRRQPTDAPGTGVTNVKLMKPTPPGGTTPYDTSTLFETGFQNAAAHFSTLRWLTANFNEETDWSGTNGPAYAEPFTGGRSAYESEIEMSNETGRDLCLTIPMRATPDYVTKLADLLAYGADASYTPYTGAVAAPVFPPLNPNLRVYFEWSNEVPWNYAFAQAHDLIALVNAAARANSDEWRIVNYDGVSDGTFDGNGNVNALYTVNARLQALKTQEASQIFRSVVGDAGMGDRVRVLLEDQYGDPHGEPQFLDHYFNKTDPASPYAGPPEPISRYVWGGGGAVYYDAQNAIGAQADTVFANPSFEADALAPGTTGQSVSGWTAAGDAGIYSGGATTIGTPPAAPDGTQAAYVADTGSLSQTVNFARAGAYAISFSAAWGHFTYGSDSQADPIRVFIDGVEVTPGYFNQGSYRYGQATGPWIFGSFGINTQAFNYVTTIAVPLSAGPHVIRFAGTGTAGQYCYLDAVAVASIDALYAQAIPATSTGGSYAAELNGEADWVKAYGLHRVSYEGGWALGAKPQVGGGDADTPFSNYARWSDPRAAGVSRTALDLYARSGGDLYGFGTYELWPAYDTDNADGYAILQGIVAAGDALPAEPTNGLSVPAVLKPASITISDNANAGTISATDGWISWNVVAPSSGTYSFTLRSAGGAPTILVDDATPVGSGGTAFLTKGLHSAKVRSDGGSVSVSSLTVAVPSAPAPPTLTAGDGDGTAVLTWTPVSGATDYLVAYGTSSGEYPAVQDAGASTGLTVTGLTNDQTYYFVVYAVGGSAQSLPSNEQAVVPLAAGQLGTLAAWDFEGYAGSEPSAPPTSATSRAVVGSLTRGAGLKPTGYHFPNTFGSEAANNVYAQNLADSITANQYYQFTIAPAGGKSLSLKTLTFLPFFQNVQGGAGDPRGAGLTVSTDGGQTFSGGIVASGTPTYSTQGSPFTVDLSGQAALQNTAGTVVFRIYLYGNGAYEFTGLGGGGANGISLSGSFTSNPPTVARPPSASPNPVTGTTTTLSVLGADAAGENTLTYTWVTVGAPPAPVTYSVNGTNAAKSSLATFTTPGTYQFQVTITDGQGATVTAGVTVTVSGTALSVPSVTGSAGQTITLSATLKTGAGTALSGKTLAFRVDGTAAGTGVTNASGTATKSYVVPTALAVGSHTLTAAFAGDSGSLASSGTGALTVTKAGTTLAVSAVSGTPGQTVTLKATLKRTAGNAALGGETVSFSVDGAAVGTAATTAAGLASLNYAIPAGDVIGSSHPVSAAFAGDGGNNGSAGNASLTVSKYAASLSLPAVSGTPGQTVTLSATLKSGAAALSGRTITFTVDGAAVGTGVTSTAGVATLAYALPAGATVGSHPVTATFAGDSTYAAATGKGTLSVKTATALSVSNVSGAHGTTVSLSATLTAGGVGLPGKTVAFKADGVTVGTAVTNANGVATLTYAIPSGDKVGSHGLGASFAGDAGDNAAVGTGTLTVN